MNKDDILSWMGEIYHYTCHDCGQSNLSRDEVTDATKTGCRTQGVRFSGSAGERLGSSPKTTAHKKSGKYICLKCYHKKSTAVDKEE